MNDQRCFEALDRSLRDLMDAPDVLFGGKTVVLRVDFRQTLPVKKGSSKFELITTSIPKSDLWWHFKVYTLTIETRNEELRQPDKEDAEDTYWLDIPAQFYVTPDEKGTTELIVVPLELVTKKL
ncbi:DNA helicase [Tanacetum coccineum]